MMRVTNKYPAIPGRASLMLLAALYSLSAAAADQTNAPDAPIASVQIFEDPNAFDGSADPFPDSDGFPTIDALANSGSVTNAPST